MRHASLMRILLLAAILGIAGTSAAAGPGLDNGPSQQKAQQTADDDGDGVPNDSDNCPTVANPDQSNLNRDTVGDACDNDDDGDGVTDSSDNCPVDINPGQRDTDGDGKGNRCDRTDSAPDDDGDGMPNASDNCPITANPGQTDSDGDGIGLACDGDLDSDNDGAANDQDNCSFKANLDQTDTDGDGIGDACDNEFNCTATYTPITGTDVVVQTNVNGICLFCGVRNKYDAIDTNPDNAARMSIAVGIGGNVQLRVVDTDTQFTDDMQIGFVIGDPNNLYSKDLLGNITLTLFSNGAEVASIRDGELLGLDLLGLLDDGRRAGERVFFSINTTDLDLPTGFDAVEIRMAGLLREFASLDVYAACFGPPIPEQDRGLNLGLGQNQES